MNKRVFLIHWHKEEAAALAATLTALGWEVAVEHGSGETALKGIKAQPPRAVVISLRRLPSHGRETADALWATKWGRQIPIVFFDGAEDKVAALHQQFPAARFTTWEQLPGVLASLPENSAPN